MSTIITVAPREVRDLVYRCARVHGCTAGVAELIGANVTFTEVHYGRAIEPFAVAMDRGDLGASSFATAPDVLAASEVEVKASGRARVTFAPPVPLAAVAGSLWNATKRGVVATDMPFGANGSTPVSELSLRLGEPSEEVLATFEQRKSAAHSNGLVVSRMWYSVIEREAALFLVDEQALDTAGEPSSEAVADDSVPPESVSPD